MEFNEKSVIPQIESNYSKLSAVEKHIADYFIHNHEKGDFSARNVSQKLSVSEASLSRFAKKCGFSGYRAFIYEYTQNISSTPEQITQSAQHVFGAYQSLLNKSYNLMSEEQITRVATMLNGAKRVFGAGKGSSGLVAREMAMRFLRIGIDFRVPEDVDSLRILPVLLTEEDAAIGMTLSGQADEVLYFLKKAKEKGSQTILITATNSEKYKEYCDEVLLVPSLKMMNYGNIISPQFPLLVITDMLYTSCMAIDTTGKSRIHEQTIDLLYGPDAANP